MLPVIAQFAMAGALVVVATALPDMVIGAVRGVRKLVRR